MLRFLELQPRASAECIRSQYTAVDDAPGSRVLQVYEKHTQANVIFFFDYVVERFPFRIHMVRTDNLLYVNHFLMAGHGKSEDRAVRGLFENVQFQAPK